MKYSDEDIDDAIGRIANDVARRGGQSDFPGPALTALLVELRHMEAARRGGDDARAALSAAEAHAALDKYRPTNATSRSKALLAEVVADVLAQAAPPA
jgi:hypothetical protein